MFLVDDKNADYKNSNVQKVLISLFLKQAENGVSRRLSKAQK